MRTGERLPVGRQAVRGPPITGNPRLGRHKLQQSCSQGSEPFRCEYKEGFHPPAALVLLPLNGWEKGLTRTSGHTYRKCRPRQHGNFNHIYLFPNKLGKLRGRAPASPPCPFLFFWPIWLAYFARTVVIQAGVRADFARLHCPGFLRYRLMSSWSSARSSSVSSFSSAK